MSTPLPASPPAPRLRGETLTFMDISLRLVGCPLTRERNTQRHATGRLKLNKILTNSSKDDLTLGKTQK